MNLIELKIQSLGITKAVFGKIYAFVDFANINYWFEKDQRDWDDNYLIDNQKLIIDIEKLGSFLSCFKQKRFYYGHDPKKKGTWHIGILAENCGFIKSTKPIQ